VCACYILEIVSQYLTQEMYAIYLFTKLEITFNY